MQQWDCNYCKDSLYCKIYILFYKEVIVHRWKSYDYFIKMYDLFHTLKVYIKYIFNV